MKGGFSPQSPSPPNLPLRYYGFFSKKALVLG